MYKDIPINKYETHQNTLMHLSASRKNHLSHHQQNNLAMDTQKEGRENRILPNSHNLSNAPIQGVFWWVANFTGKKQSPSSLDIIDLDSFIENADEKSKNELIRYGQFLDYYYKNKTSLVQGIWKTRRKPFPDRGHEPYFERDNTLSSVDEINDPTIQDKVEKALDAIKEELDNRDTVKDPQIFVDLENIAKFHVIKPDSFKSSHRDALDFISNVIKQSHTQAAKDIYNALNGNKAKQASLTSAVRPGAKHEHLMTAMTVPRLMADLNEVASNAVQNATSPQNNLFSTPYSAWDVLNDTLSDTHHIVLNTVTPRSDGLTQDHHVTSNNQIVYYPNGDTNTPKQATGEASGTGGYHKALKKEAQKHSKPKDLLLNLKQVNQNWLAKKSDITNHAANTRAHQELNVSNTMKKFNDDNDLKDIGTEVEKNRNGVLNGFDQAVNKLK